jgi:hypothetical protein
MILECIPNVLKIRQLIERNTEKKCRFIKVVNIRVVSPWTHLRKYYDQTWIYCFLHTSVLSVWYDAIYSDYLSMWNTYLQQPFKSEIDSAKMTIKGETKNIDWLIFSIKSAIFQLYSWREQVYKQHIKE